MRKKWHHSKVGLHLGAGLGALIIAFVCASQRWRQLGRAPLDRLIAEGRPPIIIFWHEHILAMPILLPAGCAALQSPHPDGKLLAYAVRWFGLKPVWGSSNRQATSGLRQLSRHLKDGQPCVITPDGPRGPARQMAAGPVAMAQLTGAPIVPVVWATKRGWRASSWDRLRIPKPFGRGIVIWGEPIELGSTRTKSEQASARQLLADRLNQLASEADQMAASGG